ncbi:MAG: SDR family NAD(P)-dependent oxidoreductase, partial [Micrococcaceae bacterium]|nr:SDR family NAD(P)-dependent oxidoreductase [Micrococcaceae bacterium]
NFYQDVFPLFAGDDHLLRGPAAEGRVSAVARDDVAAVAAVVLAEAAVAWAAGREPVHAGPPYDLTGPEAFDLHQAAAVMTEVTGVQTRYLHETVAEALASRDGLGAPDWQMDAWISTYTAIASGELEAVSADVERLRGRPAQPLRRTLERLQD